MIEDAELRDLFRVECDEHLQMLDMGLLRVETAPDDATTLEEMFRAAHSLKGTARMLGVSGVERIAHHMEDELDRARRGQAKLESHALDRYALGLVAMRQLVSEAVSGAPANVDIDRVVGQLTGQIALPAAAQNLQVVPLASPAETQILAPEISPSAPEISSPSPISPLPAESAIEAPLPEASPLEIVAFGAQAAPAPPAIEVGAAPLELPEIPQTTLSRLVAAPLTVAAPPAPAAEVSSALTARAGDEFKIQTMRVAPAKLDALMTLSSELAVTSTRVLRGMTAFEEIGALCEEWSKDLAPHRTPRPASSASNADTGADTGADAGADARELAMFRAREHLRLARLQDLWQALQAGAYQDVTRLGFLSSELEAGIRNVRLLPLSQVFGLFPRLVRDLARELGKEVDFRVEGGEIAVDKRILEEIKDPLMHMLRNALDHGIARPDEREEQGKPRVARLQLRAFGSANSVVIELQDDGRGLDIEAIKSTALARGLHSQSELEAMTPAQIHWLIFAPGFSTSALITDLSGRGVGMDVVRNNIERLKGTLRVESQPGAGTTFSIRLPSTLATTRVLLVSAQNRSFALPVEAIHTILRLENQQIFCVEGRQTTVFEGRALPIASLGELLELESGHINSNSSSSNSSSLTVVIEQGESRLGVQVEALIDEQEVMLKPLGALLKRVRNVSGVTILGAGEVCLVLGVPDLIQSATRRAATRVVSAQLPAPEPKNARKVILLAEDSITTRTQEKRILEGAGYEVVTAVDGADAYAKLETRPFDALVSDVEMPNLSGLGLAERIRQNPRWNEMPIILVTSLSSDDDKRRGVEVGANAYITKGTFEQKVLLDTLGRLV